jgi:predicted nucleic acid-binding protein
MIDFELLVLDTNFYSALTKKDSEVRRLIRSAEVVAFPQIVIGELLGGFHYGSRFEKNLNELESMLAKPSCRILMPSIETAREYGRLYAQLKKRGKIIPTNDIWIAALTIEYEGTLATYDSDFAAIPELKLAIKKI